MRIGAHTQFKGVFPGTFGRAQGTRFLPFFGRGKKIFLGDWKTNFSGKRTFLYFGGYPRKKGVWGHFVVLEKPGENFSGWVDDEVKNLLGREISTRENFILCVGESI